MADPAMAEALLRARELAMKNNAPARNLPPLEEAPVQQLQPEPNMPQLPVNEPAFLESYMGGGQADPMQVDELRQSLGEMFPEARYEGFKLPTGQGAERWVPQGYQDPGEAGQFTPIGEVMSRLQPNETVRSIQAHLARQGGPEGLESLGGDMFVHPQAGGQDQDSLRHGLLKLLGMKSRM